MTLAAERVARVIASATNRSFAGSTIAVHGDGALAQRLAAMLRGFGGRMLDAEPGRDGDRATTSRIELLVLCDAQQSAQPAAAAAARSTEALDALLRGLPLVDDAIVVDASAAGWDAGAAAGDEVRPGVRELLGRDRTAFWMRVDPSERPRTGAGSHALDAIDVVTSADRGAARIVWARRFMRSTTLLARQLGTARALEGRRIGVSLVLEPKTAVLALALADAGAEVAVFASSGETDGEVADALARLGIAVFAAADAGPDGDARHAAALLDWAPQLLVDDGAHLVRLAHTSQPEALAALAGAAEETTSGVRPLREMAAEGALRVPVIAVNDARTKTLFDNVHGTGQSCVLAIADLLDVAGIRGGRVHGGRWTVVGYGPVGVGVARHAAAMGARVTVVEHDPVRALGAMFDGLEVAPLEAAVAASDVVVSATGHAGTITVDALQAAADGCVFAVAGGVDQEIELDRALASGFARTTLQPHIEHLERPGAGNVLLLAGGDGVNYTAGEGNPIEIMDLSFATQLTALSLLAEAIGADGTSSLAPGVHELGAAGEHAIARAALAARGAPVPDRPVPDRPGCTSADDAHPWREHRYRPTAEDMR